MQVDLGLSFRALFGYSTDAFQPDALSWGGVSKGSRTESGAANSSPYYAFDSYGREYYMPVELQVGTDKMPGTNTSYADALGTVDGRWKLPYPVISVAEVAQEIVDTKLTERVGMVSELISISGYKINVKGMLINKANEFPEFDFTMLNKLVNLKVVCTISNPLTDVLFKAMGVRDNNLGEKLVTLRNLRFTNKSGVKGVVGYELDMMTDAPFSLTAIS